MRRGHQHLAINKPARHGLIRHSDVFVVIRGEGRSAVDCHLRSVRYRASRRGQAARTRCWVLTTEDLLQLRPKGTCVRRGHNHSVSLLWDSMFDVQPGGVSSYFP